MLEADKDDEEAPMGNSHDVSSDNATSIRATVRKADEFE